MNLDAEKWVVGLHYTAAPTCATCHMSATRAQPVTHYVGARISWTLRPVVSKKLEKWETRRSAMKEVCGRLTPTPFDEEVEWTFYRLWHHEGRRARMGASMRGPDFVQWHGFFEAAESFYTKFLPQAKEAAHGDSPVLSVICAVEEDRQHAWRKGLSPEERNKIDEFYRERYGKN